jgi:hypothetical protein
MQDLVGLIGGAAGIRSFNRKIADGGVVIKYSFHLSSFFC